MLKYIYLIILLQLFLLLPLERAFLAQMILCTSETFQRYPYVLLIICAFLRSNIYDIFRKHSALEMLFIIFKQVGQIDNIVD